jgi:hypothetical protein
MGDSILIQKTVRAQFMFYCLHFRRQTKLGGDQNFSGREVGLLAYRAVLPCSIRVRIKTGYGILLNGLIGPLSLSLGPWATVLHAMFPSPAPLPRATALHAMFPSPALH